MFDQNQPARSTLAPYQPRQAAAQRMDDFSFRFGEGESLKGVWSVIRKRKTGIAIAGCLGLALALARQHGPEPAISGHCDRGSRKYRCVANQPSPECSAPRRQAPTK